MIRVLGPLSLAALAGCPSAHTNVADASGDSATSGPPFCLKSADCQPCGGDPTVCQQCDLADGVCVLTCGGEPVACPHPAADACGTPLAPCTTAGAAGQVCIPGSTMLRGSNDPDLSLSYPRRAFYVSSFWLDVDEVTVARYRECVDVGACTEPPDPVDVAYLRDPANDSLPMVGASFAEAIGFCRAAGGRLPTETEWERAASGTDGRPFPWGTEVGCEYANLGGCGGALRPVGSFPLGRSPDGVNDLIGNAWELTSDRIVVRLPGGDYTAFDPEPSCDPTHAFREGVDMFVAIRGSSIATGDGTDAELRRYGAPRRGRAMPGGGGPDVGFRCARDGR